MSEPRNGRKGFYGWLGNQLEHHSSWVIGLTLLATVLLLVPLFLMTPTENASDNPTGSEVVKFYELVDDTFPSEVDVLPYIVEAKDGDILTQKCLYELYQNEEKLRGGDLSPFLYLRYIETAGAVVRGVDSLADSVNTVLATASGGAIDLSNASDLQVKQAVSYLLSNPVTEELQDRLSVKSEPGEEGWTSPAFLFVVLADGEKLRTEYAAAVGEDLSEDIAVEQFGRDVLEILRGEEAGYQVWGVGIDMNLEISDEGRLSFTLTGIAIILMAVLLMIIYRSWLITLATTLGLGMIVVWLKGFSNLIGLKGSIALELIVPIAIVVLGVDYAIQALFRYREERDKGKPPRQALGASTYGVGRALALAMLTTVIAFAANAASGIESVVGFAMAASFAIFASLIVLGLFVPAVVMRYHAWRGTGVPTSAAAAKASLRGAWLGRSVTAVGGKWFQVLPLVILVTGFAAWGWVNVETKMEAKDALDSNSDFVMGVDKLEEHITATLGEPAYLYVEGDLTQLESIDAIKASIAAMEDDAHVSRRLLDGKPNPTAFVLDMLSAVVEEDYARGQIAAATGTEVTDLDDDLVPDTPEQLEAVYEYVTANGVWQDETTVLYNPAHIGESFVYGTAGEGQDAALMWIGIPGTQNESIVRASSAELQADMDLAMQDVASIDLYGLTGDAYMRVEQFDSIADSLSRSLIIAAAGVLLLLLAAFRSLRYAVMAMIPVLLVACWLYGFMYAAGIHLNMMTAMIAALSIGVGIDFSIHITERFRQELAGGRDKRSALRESARTTGFALFCAALTTIVGFIVIAFAPMPMFATFGVLTAIMIGLSLLMALFVLPSLYILFAPGNGEVEEER